MSGKGSARRAWAERDRTPHPGLPDGQRPSWRLHRVMVLIDGPLSAEGLLADEGYELDWFKDTFGLRHQGLHPRTSVARHRGQA